MQDSPRDTRDSWQKTRRANTAVQYSYVVMHTRVWGEGRTGDGAPDVLAAIGVVQGEL